MKKYIKWFKSKTIWFSTVGIPAIMSGLFYAQANIHLVKDNLGESYALVTFVIGAICAIIRKFTTKSLDDK